MKGMREVTILPLDAARLGDEFLPGRLERFTAQAAEARALTRGRMIWNVNATAHGGGVAEMLHTLLGYVRGVGVDTRWFILTGSPEFFTVTKRLHNLLHGDPGDFGAMGAAEHAVVAEALAQDLDEFAGRISAGDIVVLHDPQTAGMVDRLRAVGAIVVWRCHVGRDDTNELTERAWSFLRPLVQHADAFVFSREGYAPQWCRTAGLRVIMPSIDPFSAKNCAMTDEEVQDSLSRSGLVVGDRDGDAVGFVRGDGSRGSVRRHDGLLVDGPPIPATARLVVQVSRWDRLKDMAGVLRGFVNTLATLPDDIHLLLVGPETSGVTDDPEGAAVLAECRELWLKLGVMERQRVHLICLPMDDGEENAHLVNALQRRSTVMVQKSLVEGFGLTVTEAMWKGRPLLASAVGGIQDQVTDGKDGLLLQDPMDLAGFGATLQNLLRDPSLASRLGGAAHHRVHEDFIGDKHLGAYVDLLRWLLRPVEDRP